MKKTIRGLLICIAVMTVTLLGMTGAAANSNVTDFDGLKAAISSGGTIVLDADIKLTEDIHATKNCTIDLNGHTLNTQTYRIAVYDATLTADDSAQNSTGKFTGAGTVLQAGEVNDKGAIYFGHLKVENCLVESATKNAIYIMPESTLQVTGSRITATTSAIISDGEVTITGGSVNATRQAVTLKSGSTYQEDDVGSGISKAYTGTLSMSGGTVSATEKAIAVSRECTATLTGGTVTAENQTILNHGKVTIQGCTVKATGETAVTTDWRGKTVIKDGAIEAPDYTLYTLGLVTIEGGTVTATDAEATALYIEGCSRLENGIPANSGIVTMNGGTAQANGAGAMAAYVTGESEMWKGALILNSGTLQGNGADGACVYLDENGTANINGGTISAVNGQGVYVAGANAALKIQGGRISADACGVLIDSSVTPDFTLYGNPAFSTTGADGCDIEILNLNTVITIGGELSNIEKISVRLGGEQTDSGAAGIFTKDYGKYHTAAPGQYFTAAGSGKVQWDEPDHQEGYLTGHQHQFEYSVNADHSKMTAACASNKCFVEASELILELIAPDPLYDGQQKTVTWDSGIYLQAFPGLDAIEYQSYDEKKQEWKALKKAPKAAGKFKAVYTPDAEKPDVYIEKEFEIYKVGSVQIQAVDETGKALAGVKFRVEQPADKTWGSDAWVSGTKAQTLHYLQPGAEYVIYAEETPEGYMVPEDVWFGCDDELAVWSDPEGLLEDGVLKIVFEAGYPITSDGTAFAYIYDKSGNMIRLTQAAPGTEVRVYLSDNALETLEDGLYLTQAYEVDGRPLGFDQNGEPVDTFVMPPQATEISAVKGVRVKKLTVTVTADGSAKMPVEALESLTGTEKTMKLLRLVDGHYEMDIDGSGKYDVMIGLPGGATMRGNCETGLLPEIDVFDKYTFKFSGAFDRYASIVIAAKKPEFGAAAVTLPAALTQITESAYEGNREIQIVYAGDKCKTIGKNAFKGCTALTQIRLPKNCKIDDAAFDAGSKVMVFAPAGGTTEAWCRKNNVMFIPE